ncbi:RNA polymerase sigma factor [uncultured Croceitalea sp.]|uniref:RNA polymerase sigma factor n=1 Tax=uncultured Croceitalea sp. TaxID=1798908 RepID=UPI00374F9DB7
MQNSNTIEHLFRNEYGKLVAVLTNKYGITYLEKIEDTVQEAFVKAMRVWGYKDIPDNPTAWLFRVANNMMIDGLRRAKKIAYVSDSKKYEESALDEEITTRDEITDSQLKMIFACCHPSLTEEHQLVLSLKLIGGFNNKELADALLKKEETVAKSFTRAKKKFKSEVKFLKIPNQMGLQSRLFIVLRVVYLLFSEGYATTTGSQILKQDICYEALRLALLLRENEYCKHPNLEALIALMCFHVARFDARIDDSDALVSLEYQDRSKFSKELIKIGEYHLENANTKDKSPSNYHLEAAVSYYHCVARTFEDTDWKSILYLYDLQLKRQYSPIVALNRIIPVSQVNGPEKALKALKKLEKEANFTSNSLFYAIKADLLFKLGRRAEQQAILQKAIDLNENELVKKHLQKKLE